MTPYRPIPESPPLKSQWRMGDAVRVCYRATTGTLLEFLEGEHGSVVEAVELDTDQCVRVRFSESACEKCPVHLQHFLVLPDKLGVLGDRYCIGLEAWIFGGDLA